MVVVEFSASGRFQLICGRYFKVMTNSYYLRGWQDFDSWFDTHAMENNDDLVKRLHGVNGSFTGQILLYLKYCIISGVATVFAETNKAGSGERTASKEGNKNIYWLIQNAT